VRFAGRLQAQEAWLPWDEAATAVGAATPETTTSFIDTPGGLRPFGDEGMMKARHLKGAVNQLRGEVTQAAKRTLLGLGIVPPPLRVQLDITDSCNFRCPTCSKSGISPSPRELQLDQWRRVLREIHTVPLLREVSISGGEPFTRPDIFEILEIAKGLGLRVVLLSNGWLVDRHRLRRLEELGVDRLMVSLNSLQESVHDESRAQAGSHERIMDLIEIWRSEPRSTDLCLATVVMEPNCAELSSLATFAAEKGLSGIMFQVLLPNEAHYAFCRESSMRESTARWHAGDPLWVKSTDRLRSEVAALLDMQRTGGGIINPPPQLRMFPLYYENPQGVRTWPCLGTLSRLYIDPFGDIRLCYGYPPIGNILQDNPREVWRSARAEGIRHRSRRCTRLCRMMNSSL
jgi:MoaA/NifB/PqqE/SkfB family radical SAM enzyme